MKRFVNLVGVIKALNGAIAEDEALGKGFCIGHSYLCVDGPVSDDWVNNVVEYEILPLLEEYWFDDPEKRDHWISRLRGVTR